MNNLNLNELLNRKKALQDSLSQAVKTRNEMDGKMQSRYDTQREEWALQCSMLENQIDQINLLIEKLSNLDNINKETEIVSIGMCVELIIDNEAPKSFILIDDSGGYSLGEITTLSIKSPIGKAVFGSSVGSTLKISLGSNDEEVVNVYVKKIMPI